jgi:hypothetical protein
VIQDWRSRVPNDSFLEVPSANYAFYKSSDGRVGVLTDGDGKGTPLVPVWAKVNSIYRIYWDKHGQLKYTNSQVNLAATNPPATTSHNLSNPVPTTNPPVQQQHLVMISDPLSSCRSIHSTTEPDKKRLAKDILRSLGPFLGKEEGKRIVDEVQGKLTDGANSTRGQEIVPLPAQPTMMQLPHMQHAPPSHEKEASLNHIPTAVSEEAENVLAVKETNGRQNMLSAPSPDVQPVPAPQILSHVSNTICSPSGVQHMLLPPGTRPSPHPAMRQDAGGLVQASTSNVTGPPRTARQSTLETASHNTQALTPSSSSRNWPSGPPIDISDDSSEDEQPVKTSLIKRSASPPLLSLSLDPLPSTSGTLKEPLFLPSPTSSPSQLSNGAAGDEYAIDVGGESPMAGEASSAQASHEVAPISGMHTPAHQTGLSRRPGKTRPQVYVLVPAFPEWAKRRRKQRREGDIWMGERARKQRLDESGANRSEGMVFVYVE